MANCRSLQASRRALDRAIRPGGASYAGYRRHASSAAGNNTTLYAVEKSPTPTLSVVGSNSRFPVRRVYCVGSNYRAHAIEMGGNPDKNPPFFFTKPPDAAFDVSLSGPGTTSTVHYPPETEDLQHEVEMVVAIGIGGRGISPDRALQHVFGYGVGVDLTRRDMQHAAKKAGRPWDCSKGFDSSGPIGALTPVVGGGIGIVGEGAGIWLEVNGETRQRSVLGEMVWSVPEMIARLSELFTLQPGDILFTGTPSGVLPLSVGDIVDARVEGLEPCLFEVGPILPPTSRM